MSLNFLIQFSLVGMALSPGAWARQTPVCNNKVDCQFFISHGQSKIGALENEIASIKIDILDAKAALNKIGGGHSAYEQQRVSVSGAVFELDTSNPLLGEGSYRDPSGVIWGSYIRDGMNHIEADNFCKKRNARLPTLDEHLRLIGQYLSTDGKESGYSPYIAGTNSDIIYRLEDFYFWTGTDDKGQPVDTSNLNGRAYWVKGWWKEFSHRQLRLVRDTNYGAVRCVSGP